MRLTLINIDNN